MVPTLGWIFTWKSLPPAALGENFSKCCRRKVFILPSCARLWGSRVPLDRVSTPRHIHILARDPSSLVRPMVVPTLGWISTWREQHSEGFSLGKFFPPATLGGFSTAVQASLSVFSLYRLGRGGDESKRQRAESQWIVAKRPLCHLQYPVAYLSRMQRILPVAR